VVVDCHSHLYPRSYVELLRARAEIPRVAGDRGSERFVIFPEEDVPGGGRPLRSEFWEVGAKLGFMDEHGIDRCVVSLGNPWLDPFVGPESPGLARDLNAELGALGPETGGRIVALGVLPANEVGAAAQTVDEIAATDGLHGAIAGPRICGLTLDDPRLDAVWSALERTALPLFVHPHSAAAVEDLRGWDHVLPLALGFPFETSIAVARLVLGGVLGRFPDLKVLAAHGGGTLPFLAGRFDVAWRAAPALRQRLPRPPSEDLARIHADAVVYHPRALRALVDLVGPERVVFGTDHPFFNADVAPVLAMVRETLGADAEMILGANPKRLFGL
jgi:aminocarboxymuconate-semialdehyde decarboxylase